MSLFTSNDLKRIARANGGKFAKANISESLKPGVEFDIFLSHSYLDKEEVEGLYLVLTDYGFKVYVDWIVDADLDRAQVTKSSANLIRQRMKSSKTLLLGVSTNASLSKWMPWELGFMDAHTGRCAVIPVSREVISRESYKGFEYLSLYPFIKEHPNRLDQDRLWVIEAADKYVVFNDWLEKGEQPSEREFLIY